MTPFQNLSLIFPTDTRKSLSQNALCTSWSMSTGAGVVQSPSWLLRPHGLEPPQAPLSTGFSRQEYWRGLPFPSPEKLPDPGITSGFPIKQEDSLPTEPPGKSSAYFHRGILKIVFLLPVIQNGHSSTLSQWHLTQRDFFSYFNGLSPTHLFQSPNLDEMKFQFANILIKPLKAIWRAYILLFFFSNHVNKPHKATVISATSGRKKDLQLRGKVLFWGVYHSHQ